MSKLEDLLAGQVRMTGLPDPVREFTKAIPKRRFRFDFAWPEHRLLLEVQGGSWIGGGHSTGKGMSRDAEKNNLAALEGWTVLYATTDQIRSHETVLFLRRFFTRLTEAKNTLS